MQGQSDPNAELSDRQRLSPDDVRRRVRLRDGSSGQMPASVTSDTDFRPRWLIWRDADCLATAQGPVDP